MTVSTLSGAEIRQRFIDYFVERGHLHLSGLPLVPNDASITTLFTIAGMQQMIPYFLGREQAPAANMTTVQKTIRTNDIDEVGDLSHCTFFEMLGNFSVGKYEGSYFKDGAIAYTWDFLVNVLGIPADRWWAVTYPGDEEARRAWLEAGVPEERIGETEDNWWGPPGAYGPCGPNSEIHYDRGVQYSCGRSDCRPETECCDRFVEIWNDVFMSFYQEESGERRPLPWNNVDTGMGFERLAMVVQGKESIYDTDIYQSIMSAVPVKRDYGHEATADRSLRIIADHSRAVTFIVSDGVMPSSEGRGYVLRRILRRAALHGRLLGIDRPFLAEPVRGVIDLMADFYTDLHERRHHILDVVHREEERFRQTLNRGLGLFEQMASRAAQDGRIISGSDAFELYDTHGFPLEMTMELAHERGLQVDEPGFQDALEEQRRRARAGGKFEKTIGTTPEIFSELAATVPPTEFTGYDELRTQTEVVAILAEGQPVRRGETGDTVEVILRSTPFYAESGGQVGDTGVIRGSGALVRVTDTQRPYQAFIVHEARVLEGTISVGDFVEAEVDAERRLHILPHHSGTHLLHKALQEVLGRDATQAGSLVAPDRLRFDFTWSRALTDDEVREVQDRVNAAIWANLPVRRELKPYDEAITEGAMALFGEKYGDLVRVVSMGDWSKELCGGTHVDATGDIGLFVITGETGIGSGIRRIEALAGAAAYAYLSEIREQVNQAAAALETQPDAIVARAIQVMGQLKTAEGRIESLTRQLAVREAESLLAQARSVGTVRLIADRVSADSADYVQAVSDAVKSRLGSGIVALGADVGGKSVLTLAVSRDLVDAGFNASQILREAASLHGAGGAGGRAELARGGGADPSKLDAVLATVGELVEAAAGQH